MSGSMTTNTDQRVTTYHQTVQTTTETSETRAGKGVSDVPVIHVPTADNPLGGPAMSSFSMIFASATLGPIRQADMDLVLAEVSAKLKDTRSDTELESVKSNQELIRTSQRDKSDKLAEQTEKIKEAVAAEGKNKIASIFSTIFKAIGAALAIAFAGVALATGVGAPLAGLLVAAALVAIVSLADDISKHATGHTMLGAAMKATGADPATIQKVEEVYGYVMLGVSIALAVATLGVGLKSAIPKIAGKVAEKAGQLATQVAQESLKQALTTVAKKAGNVAANVSDEALTVGNKAMSETARTTLTTVQKTTQVASGVNTVGTGATGIAQASLTKEAQDAYAAASDKKGEADIYEAFIQTYQDLVDQALANLMAAQDTANAMLEAAAGGLKDRGDSMSQVRFAG